MTSYLGQIWTKTETERGRVEKIGKKEKEKKGTKGDMSREMFLKLNKTSAHSF